MTMVIGSFQYDASRDIYAGEISTLMLSHRNVEFRPTDKSGGKEPDYRIVGDSADGAPELGAAWKRQAKHGEDYLSVVLDDPSLPQPVNAGLMLTPDSSQGLLIWSRANRRDPRSQASRGRR